MNKCKKIIGPWTLKDAYFPKDQGKVFSCFSCAGGSTMGYKLAGFDVIGCNEIDPKIFEMYKMNHNPKYSYVMSIRDMINKDTYPDELYNLDILDGSPPCTSFSTAGVRERDWGKAKKFAEGQALQRLDDLFFEFIALAEKLQPKIIIAENVSGMIKGKAKGYIKEIIKAYSDIGYDTQLFLLNADNMGVPQSRQRVFFISRKRSLKLSKLKLKFNENPITFRQASKMIEKYKDPKENVKLSSCFEKMYSKVPQGKTFSKYHPKGNFFNTVKLSYKKPIPTYCAGSTFCHPEIKRHISYNELLICSSFPMDFKYENIKKARWAMGMSVPPFMIQRIALQVIKQWNLKD
jgi:DNA (cytosine-5)-methyltransferase 1